MKTERRKGGGESGASRVDKLVAQLFPSLTQRHIEEALEKGAICSTAGRRLKKGDKLESPSLLETRGLKEHLDRIRLGNAALDVVVVERREAFLVIDKPSGMASHPLGLYDENTVTNWALAHYPALQAEFPAVQPTVTPHRLDTGTSGCLIVALTADAYAEWRGRFQNKVVEKEYLAWCWGAPPAKQFHVSWPIGHDNSDRRKMTIADKRARRGRHQAAETEIQIEEIDEKRGLCLARAICRTGVTHQVRVHLAASGLPLVGDSLYDPNYQLRSLRPKHHWLRAWRLVCGIDRFQVDASSFRRWPEAEPREAL